MIITSPKCNFNEFGHKSKIGKKSIVSNKSVKIPLAFVKECVLDFCKIGQVNR